MSMQDIRINAGEDFEMEIDITDDAGAAYPLTGCSFAGQVRDDAQSATVRGSFTFTVIDEAGGKVLASMTNTVTSALSTAGKVCDDLERKSYDIEMTATDLKITRIAAGYALISPGVTR